MQARLPDDNTMNVTVSVRVDEDMVPVIGMSLKRVDGAAGRRDRSAVQTRPLKPPSSGLSRG